MFLNTQILDALAQLVATPEENHENGIMTEAIQITVHKEIREIHQIEIGVMTEAMLIGAAIQITAQGKIHARIDKYNSKYRQG